MVPLERLGASRTARDAVKVKLHERDGAKERAVAVKDDAIEMLEHGCKKEV